MQIHPGYLVAFRSSLRACLALLRKLVDDGKAVESDLSGVVEELKCMQRVLDRAAEGKQ